MYPVWWGLAWQEIRQRYTRSIIGPFWITLSMGAMVGAMGPLYGALFGQNVASYIQYLAVSLIVWTFISSCLNEAGSVFVGAEGYIKQVALPLTIYVLKMISRNLLMLAHNAVVALVVLLILPPARWQTLFLAPLGLLLVIANLCWIILLVGMLSARFRDLPQLVTNVVQVMFFLSPVMWKADMLGNRRILAEINPLYHLIEIVRAPLLGDEIRLISWVFCTMLLILGGGLTFKVFVRLRGRVPYWL